MPDGYFLSPKDYAEFRRVMDSQRRGRLGSTPEDKPNPTTDIYVARPVTTPISQAFYDNGLQDVSIVAPTATMFPGSALCDLYTIIENPQSGISPYTVPYLQPLGRRVRVYNITDSSIPLNSWLIVQKTAGGQYVCADTGRPRYRFEGYFALWDDLAPGGVATAVKYSVAEGTWGNGFFPSPELYLHKDLFIMGSEITDPEEEGYYANYIAAFDPSFTDTIGAGQNSYYTTVTDTDFLGILRVYSGTGFNAGDFSILSLIHMAASDLSEADDGSFHSDYYTFTKLHTGLVLSIIQNGNDGSGVGTWTIGEYPVTGVTEDGNLQVTGTPCSSGATSGHWMLTPYLKVAPKGLPDPYLGTKGSTSGAGVTNIYKLYDPMYCHRGVGVVSIGIPSSGLVIDGSNAKLVTLTDAGEFVPTVGTVLIITSSTATDIGEFYPGSYYIEEINGSTLTLHAECGLAGSYYGSCNYYLGNYNVSTAAVVSDTRTGLLFIVSMNQIAKVISGVTSENTTVADETVTLTEISSLDGGVLPLETTVALAARSAIVTAKNKIEISVGTPFVSGEIGSTLNVSNSFYWVVTHGLSGPYVLSSLNSGEATLDKDIATTFADGFSTAAGDPTTVVSLSTGVATALSDYSNYGVVADLTLVNSETFTEYNIVTYDPGNSLISVTPAIAGGTTFSGYFIGMVVSLTTTVPLVVKTGGWSGPSGSQVKALWHEYSYGGTEGGAPNPDPYYIIVNEIPNIPTADTAKNLGLIYSADTGMVTWKEIVEFACP